jgi:hypothetical protein
VEPAVLQEGSGNRAPPVTPERSRPRDRRGGPGPAHRERRALGRRQNKADLDPRERGRDQGAGNPVLGAAPRAAPADRAGPLRRLRQPLGRGGARLP